MNEFYRGVILSLVRKALTGVAATLVTYGWLTDEQTTTIVVGVAGLLVSIGLSVWSKYKDTLVKLAGLQLPAGSTLEQAKLLAGTASVAPVNTPVTEAPPSVPTATIQNIKASAPGTGGGSGPFGGASTYGVVLLVCAIGIGSIGCGGKRVVSTPAEGAKLGADVLHYVNVASETVLGQYKQGNVPEAAADRYFGIMKTVVIPTAEKVRIGLDTWYLATTPELKLNSAMGLRQLLATLEAGVKQALNVELPPGVSKSIAGTVSSVYSIIEQIKALIAQAQASTILHTFPVAA